MQRLVGGSHGGVGVAMPQSLRGVGVAREGVVFNPPGIYRVFFASVPSPRVGEFPQGFLPAWGGPPIKITRWDFE